MYIAKPHRNEPTFCRWGKILNLSPDSATHPTPTPSGQRGTTPRYNQGAGWGWGGSPRKHTPEIDPLARGRRGQEHWFLRPGRSLCLPRIRVSAPVLAARRAGMSPPGRQGECNPTRPAPPHPASRATCSSSRSPPRGPPHPAVDLTPRLLWPSREIRKWRRGTLP